MTIGEWMDAIVDNLSGDYDTNELLDILDTYADDHEEPIHGNDEVECTCRTCKGGDVDGK